MRPFALARPADAASLLALLSGRARPKGGGMDLLDLAKAGVSSFDTLADLSGVPGLDGIEAGGDGPLALGARVTLARLAASPEVAKACPALAEAAGAAATPQVRNVATLAGNLLQRPRCAYFRDPFFECRKRGGSVCPAMEGEHAEGAVFGNGTCCAVHPSNLAVALLALGGTLEIRAAGKEGAADRSAPVDPDLFVAPEEDPLREARVEPGELVLRVLVPRRPASAYVEVDQKRSFDWASASAAVALEVEGGKVRSARVALGAVAPVPLLSEAAAKALVGKAPDAAAAAAAAEAAAEGARPLRDNAHKVPHLRACVRRAVLAAAGRGR